MKVQASILINRPREKVFDCVISMAFIQQWIAPFQREEYTLRPESGYRETYHSIRTPEMHQVSGGEVGVGITFKQSNESRGHPLEAIIEVTKYKLPEVFAAKVTTEIGISETEWIFHSTSEGTITALTFDTKPRGIWINLVTFIASIATKKSRTGSSQYMERIKDYIEDQC